MEYLVILKNETDGKIRKFNEIKRWFFKNFSRKNMYNFCYEHKVNLSSIKSLNFFVIGPNTFPLLTTVPFQSYSKNFLLGNSKNNSIAYITLKKPLINKKEDLKKVYNVDFQHIWEIMTYIPKRNDYLFKFSKDKVKSASWFYVEDRDIENFLNYLEREYFTWHLLNSIKLKIAARYPNIIYYEGKNKLESKKLVEKLNVNMPKTYKVFNNISDITQDEINKLPNCIIKPTNWDGSKFIFRNLSKNPIDAAKIRDKLKNFDRKNINKELMPLIYKSYKPKIIAEELIKDLKGENGAPCEFKFYVFDRKILFLLAINRKAHYNKFDFYDENFVQIPNSKLSYERTQINFKWPKLDYFEKLKKDVIKIYDEFNRDLENSFVGRFIRIDFFVNKDDYWFGEFSLFPNGGSGQNVSNFGKKYFVKNWLPEVFEIFDGKPITKEKITLDVFNKEIEDMKKHDKKPNKKLRFQNKNEKLINFLFS